MLHHIFASNCLPPGMQAGVIIEQESMICVTQITSPDFGYYNLTTVGVWMVQTNYSVCYTIICIYIVSQIFAEKEI